MKFFLRLAIGLGVVVLLTAGWIAYYDAREWLPWFIGAKGKLVNALADNDAIKDGVTLYDVQLDSDNGLRVHGRLSVPAAEGGPWPAVVLVAGAETGSKAINLLPPQKKLIVLALDYPQFEPLNFSGIVPGISSTWSFRNACLRMVPATLLAGDFLQTQRLVKKERIALVGVSIGAVVAAAAGAADTRFSQIVLLQGGANIPSIVRANAARLNLPLSPDTAASIGSWLFKPLDPARYAARIAPRPLTMLNSKADTMVPAGCAQALFDRASEPKKLLWMEGEHVTPDERMLIAELSRRVMAELASGAPAAKSGETTADKSNKPPPVKDTMGR